ncbi:sensor histidine kinase [Kineococcus gypseus]|uniref:sensor histidine kinase n=1 Tax=Kineococcus gypseus TaxID=1637102 RepID=UPI003D7C4524
MGRRPGRSVRFKLTISYAAFLVVAGALLLAVVQVFLLRYVPDGVLTTAGPPGRRPQLFVPNRSDLVRAFAPRAAAALAFLLVLGVAGGWFLAGRVLAPLHRITAATRTAAGGSLSHRIRLPGRADEFRELADSFDAMLAQLESHVAEQRRFAANASHELRTPLAITRALLDVAREDPRRDTDDLLQRLGVVNARAVELTEALLLLSRADRLPATLERVDLSLLAEEAAEVLLPLAERHGTTLETCGEVTPTTGSRALLLQMTTNLLHNALVHNLPSRGTARVSTASVDGSAVLVVENTGEEVPAELLPTLTEPFQRGAERVRHGHAGVGLGLAVVQSVVRAHGGALTLSARPGGGLRVEVRLPTAPR